MLRLALIMALLAPGAPPTPPEPLPVRAPVAKGDPAPGEGVWLSLPEVGRIVMVCKKAEDERDELRKIVLSQDHEGWSTSALVVGAGLGVVVGLAAGVWLVRSAK